MMMEEYRRFEARKTAFFHSILSPLDLVIASFLLEDESSIECLNLSYYCHTRRY